jgi:hypothetical protein
MIFLVFIFLGFTSFLCAGKDAGKISKPISEEVVKKIDQPIPLLDWAWQGANNAGAAVKAQAIHAALAAQDIAANVVAVVGGQGCKCCSVIKDKAMVAYQNTPDAVKDAVKAGALKVGAAAIDGVKKEVQAKVSWWAWVGSGAYTVGAGAFSLLPQTAQDYIISTVNSTARQTAIMLLKEGGKRLTRDLMAPFLGFDGIYKPSLKSKLHGGAVLTAEVLLLLSGTALGAHAIVTFGPSVLNLAYASAGAAGVLSLLLLGRKIVGR